MIQDKFIKQFKGLVKANQRFVISGHQGPDGDVIGSTLALYWGLKKIGKKVIPYNADGCPQFLKFLKGSELITPELPKDPENWVLITVDSGDLQRLGEKIETTEFKEIWNIDHHKSNTKFGKYNFIDIKAGSTGQVVFELLSRVPKFKLTAPMANAVFCTLSTDTGSFKYRNSTPEVFALASKLVAAGAEPHSNSEALYETYEAKRLRLLARVLESLKFEHDGKVSKILLHLQDLKDCGASPEDTEEFVNLPRGVIGVRVALFIKEKSPTEWKISLRARGDVDVMSIAKVFGGGGHKLAAGCTIRGNLSEVEAQLDEAVVRSGVLK